jgi:hypothetical protein
MGGSIPIRRWGSKDGCSRPPLGNASVKILLQRFNYAGHDFLSAVPSGDPRLSNFTAQMDVRAKKSLDLLMPKPMDTAMETGELHKRIGGKISTSSWKKAKRSTAPCVHPVRRTNAAGADTGPFRYRPVNQAGRSLPETRRDGPSPMSPDRRPRPADRDLSEACPSAADQGHGSGYPFAGRSSAWLAVFRSSPDIDRPASTVVRYNACRIRSRLTGRAPIRSVVFPHL